MKKILVIPNKSNLELVLNSKVDGLILPLESLACEYDYYYSLADIKKILNKTKKEVCVCINKIMHDDDLKNLEMALITLNKMNISKIFFYDVSVLKMCRDMNINKKLVVFQDHLNASYLTNRFYKNNNVSYSVITNDITKEEINEISKYQDLMMICYGYLPIFYSRRYLVSNYLQYIGKNNTSDVYYIKHDDDYYPIMESDSGTCVYTKKPINLINEINDLNIEYIILNSFLIDDSNFIKIMEDYIEGNISNDSNYLGFLNEKTIYKVKDNG